MPATRPASRQQVRDLGLEQREVRLVLEHRADRLLVQRTIGLGTRRAHGRTLARVQRPELDAGAIDGLGHRAAERVDLLDEVALADAADRGVAAHLPERFDALGDEQRATAHPGGRKGRLGAGVAAAHHDHVEDFSETHGCTL